MGGRSATAAMAWLMAFSVAPAAFAAAVREELVSFVTHDGFEIRCILSTPDQGTGPFPGMLLIAGSGLHDADVTLDLPMLQITDGRQTLFRSLARTFSRQGWAVQRCNKRGATFGHVKDQPHILDNATLEDLTRDAAAALGTLHDHPQVAASPLVVVGHSEGTLIATRLARANPEIDLLVLIGTVARSFDDLLEYQLVDRNLAFLEQAADANGDGVLTLRELDRLDGSYGLGSVYVRNSASILFSTRSAADGSIRVRGLNRATDTDDDGRLSIREEIEPALRREITRFLQLAENGTLGRYWQSLVEAGALSSRIDRVSTPLLLVHGALDVQTPVDETLSLIARLEASGRTDYDVLIFPALGHSLSKPNDFYRGDGGLTVLDNLTLNAPKAGTRRQLLQRIQKLLER